MRGMCECPNVLSQGPGEMPFLNGGLNGRAGLSSKQEVLGLAFSVTRCSPLGISVSFCHFSFLLSFWPSEQLRRAGWEEQGESGAPTSPPAPHLLFILHQGSACYFLFPRLSNVFSLLECQENSYLCSEHIVDITFSGKSTLVTASASASGLITFASVHCTRCYCCTYHAVLDFLIKHFFLSC